jgi:hypothetical protein
LSVSAIIHEPLVNNQDVHVAEDACKEEHLRNELAADADDVAISPDFIQKKKSFPVSNSR